ncbi:MAG: radical SAM protein [Syntrophomonadaceae bacterium]|nr:radical SAM protein [Syntrophomonadaceae bacterium]
MKKLDVLIINPNARNEVYQELSGDLAAVEPPVWAALIANYLRKKCYSVALLDAEGEQLSVNQTALKLPEYDPRLVVIVVYGQHPSASTQTMYAGGKLCSRIKENYPQYKVILIGGHISALPERTLLDEKADFVCQGEGPYTISALLETNLKDQNEFAKVPGLWYRKEGKPVFSGPAPLIAQERLAEELPGMAFDLLPMSTYRAHNWHCFGNIKERQPYASLYTSLGCPFKCSFCCINAPFGRPGIRYWEPQFIIKQFELLALNYNVKNIKIADEMFVLNENHFLKLCELLKERNFGFNIWAYSRIDSVKPRHLEALKEAGINWLAIGIESGNKDVRNGVSKGRINQNDIRETVKGIKNAGINIVGNYIFGLPDDNYETMQETLNLAVELNCEMANFYSAMAYPGSALYQFALENNWELPATWLGYSQYSHETIPLRTNYLTAGEVLTFRDEAWNKYFTNPAYLGFIKNKFGFETFSHIIEMTKYKPRRRYAAKLFDKE